MQQPESSRTFNADRWTVLTTAGLAGGLIAGLLVGMPLGRLVNAMIVTASVTCVVGGVLGSFQAAGLRRLLSKPLWWIAATIVGLGIGLALGVVTVEQAGILLTGNRPRIAQLGTATRAISFVVLGVIAGAVLGVAQSVVLRVQKSKVRHWTMANGAALALALCLASLAVDVSGVRFASGIGVFSFLILSGVMFGGLTSWPLRSAA